MTEEIWVRGAAGIAVLIQERVVSSVDVPTKPERAAPLALILDEAWMVLPRALSLLATWRSTDWSTGSSP